MCWCNSDFYPFLVAPKWRISHLSKPLQRQVTWSLVTFSFLVPAIFPEANIIRPNKTWWFKDFKDKPPIGLTPFRGSFKLPFWIPKWLYPILQKRDGAPGKFELPPCPPSILRNPSAKQKHRCRPVLWWDHPNLKTCGFEGKIQMFQNCGFLLKFATCQKGLLLRSSTKNRNL